MPLSHDVFFENQNAQQLVALQNYPVKSTCGFFFPIYQTAGLKILHPGAIASLPASMLSTSILGPVVLLFGLEFGVGRQ